MGMLHKRANDSDGFTVAELLIVVAIIGVLVAIAIPVFSASAASAKQAADDANCRSAKGAATSECISAYAGDFEKMTTATCIEVALNSGIPRNGQVDPKSTLQCSFDSSKTSVTFVYGKEGSSGNDSGSGPSGTSGFYPGTSIPLDATNGSWPQQSAWDDDANKSISIPAGGIFEYSGKYYVVSKTTSVTKGQAASGPGGDLKNWYATHQITGRVITDWTTNSQKSDLQRGDICRTQNGNYVYIDGGSWGVNPEFQPSSTQWYRLP